LPLRRERRCKVASHLSSKAYDPLQEREREREGWCWMATKGGRRRGWGRGEGRGDSAAGERGGGASTGVEHEGAHLDLAGHCSELVWVDCQCDEVEPRGDEVDGDVVPPSSPSAPS
jgi:hypothetical protein